MDSRRIAEVISFFVFLSVVYSQEKGQIAQSNNLQSCKYLTITFCGGKMKQTTKTNKKTVTKLTSLVLLGLLSFDCLAKQASCTLTDFMFLFQLPKERSVSGLPQAKHGPLIESREITLIDTYHLQIVLNTKEY